MHRILLVLVKLFSGQESPDCFELGECTGSLVLNSWDRVSDAQICLDLCRYVEGCEYFTFYVEGCEYFTFYDDDNTCLSLGNCAGFSSDSCNDCYSGYNTCEGTNMKIVI